MCIRNARSQDLEGMALHTALILHQFDYIESNVLFLRRFLNKILFWFDVFMRRCDQKILKKKKFHCFLVANYLQDKAVFEVWILG